MCCSCHSYTMQRPLVVTRYCCKLLGHPKHTHYGLQSSFAIFILFRFRSLLFVVHFVYFNSSEAFRQISTKRFLIITPKKIIFLRHYFNLILTRNPFMFFGLAKTSIRIIKSRIVKLIM